MSQYLRSRWFGRRVHPVAFFTSLWSAWSAWLIVSDQEAFVRIPLGLGIGLWQASATVILWAGWWLRRRPLLMTGLLWAAGGIAAVSATVCVEFERLDPSAVFGLIFAGAVAWSWQLEREDTVGRGGR